MASTALNNLAWALLCTALLTLSGCRRAPSEDALRASVAALQQALDDRDASALEALLAEDFVGPQGLDRDGARRMAALQWMRHDRIGVVVGPLDVRVSERHGTVRFSSALTGGSSRLLPDSAQAYEVETGWRFDDGAWRMTSAEWKPKF